MINQTEIFPAFGRDVDVAGFREWSGCDPEHFLLEDPCVDVFGDGFVEGAHFDVRSMDLGWVVEGLWGK